MLDKTGQKFMGVIHCRNVNLLPQILTDIHLKTSDVGRQQGVPAISDDILKNTVDITFVCTQRTQVTPLFASSRQEQVTVDYSLRGKRPYNLGNLLILWALVSLLDAGFYGTMLEVVSSRNNARNKEGFSEGPVNTAVAAFYQRYFKFQRSGTLRDFQPGPALAFFHPGWEAYIADPPTSLEVMYRPYPTIADLSDMVARLVSLLETYYR